MKTSAIGDEVDFFQDAKEELRAERSTGGTLLLFTIAALFAATELTYPRSPHKEQVSNESVPWPAVFLAAEPPRLETKDETHIPAIQPGSQTAPRFSVAHGHQSWP